MQDTHRITTDLERRIIRVEFLLEEDTKEDREKCMKEVSEIMSKDSWEGLLIDTRTLKDPMPVVEQLQIGQSVQKSMMSLIKTAMLYNPNGGNVNEFITAVSKKRGRRIQEFTDAEEAEAWLAEQ
ncbi:MAG: hypothetical protein HN542_00390 [Flavobacteriales bacterium]|nr:hypothetical protein [Flavobacteriales bacterium]MBT3963690.1 hypothetical protein [Flavobacteriales bacterium]MBT4704472.1 hypothetical protein [Flavobacteriales bacterium]MBT4931227.1 hypothetical protein [Flavobacteriales bacterium]MBT5131996.1 hypothetical protein [Flavobacteriales bacterium]